MGYTNVVPDIYWLAASAHGTTSKSLPSLTLYYQTTCLAFSATRATTRTCAASHVRKVGDGSGGCKKIKLVTMVVAGRDGMGKKWMEGKKGESRNRKMGMW